MLEALKKDHMFRDTLTTPFRSIQVPDASRVAVEESANDSCAQLGWTIPAKEHSQKQESLLSPWFISNMSGVAENHNCNNKNSIKIVLVIVTVIVIVIVIVITAVMIIVLESFILVPFPCFLLWVRSLSLELEDAR